MNSETTLALNDAISEKSTPFLPYDYMRCASWTCADRESCLRWLTKDDCGPRTETVVWAEEPKNKMECGMHSQWTS